MRLDTPTLSASCCCVKLQSSLETLILSENVMVALPFIFSLFITSSTSSNILTELHLGAIIRVKFGEVISLLYVSNFILSMGKDEVLQGR